MKRADSVAVSAVVVRGTFRLDVEFAIEAGEVLGLIGPNGAGKTTVLRALAGLTPLTAGHIRIAGETVDDTESGLFIEPEHRPIGYVFQNYRLFPNLTVRDNVAFGPRCRGVSRTDARHIADDWLARLDLSDLATRKPARLSGGQAQRVALARALAADPALLLLDEPLAALDARTKLQVRAELRRHLTDFPGATLLVTHDPLEAMVMTDRLLVIENGRIAQHGTPADVARRPATHYVARLVGLNLYRGRLDPDGHVRLDDGGVLTAPVPRSDAPALSGPVLVAIRPNAIAVHTTHPDHASPRNVWPATIAGLESLTDRVRADIAGSPPALVDLTPDAVAELGLVENKQVWLSAKATDVDVYPDPR
jgi:molybdate transport system ATP-binding protein